MILKIQTVFQAAPSELTSQLRIWLIGDRLAITGQSSPTCIARRRKKKTSKPTIAQCLSLVLPVKNTWIQINAASMPPTLPKGPGLRVCCKVLTHLHQHPPPHSLGSGRICQTPAERTPSLPSPKHLAWGWRGREVLRGEEHVAHLIFLFPQPFLKKSPSVQLPKCETQIPLWLLPLL